MMLSGVRLTLTQAEFEGLIMVEGVNVIIKWREEEKVIVSAKTRLGQHVLGEFLEKNRELMERIYKRGEKEKKKRGRYWK
jgi:hypothetical protein